MSKRTLIVTLPPMAIGGVTTKARILASVLRQAGHEVTVAYYAIPSISGTASSSFGDVREVAVPTQARWLEQQYTAPSPAWRELIDAHERHVAVGGTVLVANPLAVAGVRHMVWCAADLAGDRRFRRLVMPWWRRFGDAVLVAPSLRRQQDRVLAADNRIYGVSNDTVARLAALAPARADSIRRLPIPVDTDMFAPGPARQGGCRLGFAGRLDDPRKNADLLFAVAARVRAAGVDASLALTGAATPALIALAARHGITDVVAFRGVLAPTELRGFYQGLDVFVMTSLHEGLAIAGLEAMACGVPVVSTRCGGPADYVEDGVNGRLCGFDANDIADAIVEIGEPEKRALFSAAARRTVEKTYQFSGFEKNLTTAWADVWNESL